MLTSSHFKEVRREIQCRNAGRQRVINLLFTLFQNRIAAASFKNAAGFALIFTQSISVSRSNVQRFILGLRFKANHFDRIYNAGFQSNSSAILKLM